VGVYTLPDLAQDLPFGLGNSPVDSADLVQAFAQDLILLLGELDNATEMGGTLLRSPTADNQGLHPLARGKYFFEQGKKLAESWGCDFTWNVQVVPGVGHDQEGMGKAAAELLYGE